VKLPACTGSHTVPGYKIPFTDKSGQTEQNRGFGIDSAPQKISQEQKELEKAMALEPLNSVRKSNRDLAEDTANGTVKEAHHRTQAICY
jgi:hypothetical protein